eukprot:265832_1
MNSLSILLSILLISFITLSYSEDSQQNNAPNTNDDDVTTQSPSETQPNEPQTTTNNEDIPSTTSTPSTPSPQDDIFPNTAGSDIKTTIQQYQEPVEDDDDIGGGVWSSIGMIAIVICGCICLERLYSSCKKVYMKRTGRYGFS